VTQLPTTPDSLQDYHTSGTTTSNSLHHLLPLIYCEGKWQGELSAQLGYALAMTQNQAIVWRFVQRTMPVDYVKPITINLLHPSNNPRHPLPLGILMPTSSEPGLLVIMPTTGKITYWESLSSAANADASRQKQQNIHGAVQGLLSGEFVTKITEAEPRGFVLTMSTGRLAHLMVSDTQGKPLINAQFLRDNGASSGGVFGSLRNVFSTAGWKKDVAAVKASISYQRGQRYIIVATKKGTFQTWELNWNGTHALVNDVDAKDQLLQALAEAADGFHDDDEHSLEILDFTLLHVAGSGKAVAIAKQGGDCRLMVLTVFKGANSSRYALIGLSIANESMSVDVVHPINCYKSSLPVDTEFRPQLLIPETAQTAFVIFERTLVLVSLAEIDETPSSQLQMEAHTLPDPFQDAIDFCKTKPYRVVGCASEPYDQSHAQPSCVVLIYGFGAIRVSALPLKEGQSALERATVTAKTKIEQAVFFGSLQQDLLDFTPRPEIEFSSVEIESAALGISHSIMSSTSTYIPAIGPSMDQQLQRKSTALADLNKYLRKHYQYETGRLTKWKLLWNAEKMASATAIWRCYNLAVTNQQRGSDDKNLLTELIEAMSEDIKTENQPEHHETDGVRHWFIHDVWRLEHILPWAQNMVEILYKESIEDSCKMDVATQARFVNEAIDIQLAGLETAFKFREANAATYGLGDETMVDGVLQRGYDDLPQFWTSTNPIVERVKQLTDINRELINLEEDPDENGNEPSPELIFKLAADNPRQVQICCQTYIERFRWLKSRPDLVSRNAGEELMQAHFKVRKMLFVSLPDIGQPDKGIHLAEKYRDMEALVDIIDQEMASADSGETAQMYVERVYSYLTKFGTAWGDAYFKKHLNAGNAVAVLTDNVGFKKHLTRFLRSHPPYAKLSWINEVVSERNYLVSSDNLKLAEKQETSLWSKKIGLSMSKLSLMAATLQDQIIDTSTKSTIQGIDEKMAVLAMQEKLYKYMKPTVRYALDAEAEIELAMQKYGTRFVKDKPVLRKTLEQYLQEVLAMEALSSEGLIDVLTLIDDETLDIDEEGVMDVRFFSALKVLRLSNLEASDPGHKILLERSIWRRCMIQDNWVDVNRTELKDDTQVEVETGATSLFKTLREGYRTGFWDKSAPLPPSSLTEAGRTLESLKISSHYSNMPDTALQVLAQDLDVEAELLDQYIEKGRLDEWWQGVVEAAKAAARAEADEQGEEKLRKRNAAREFDHRLTKMDKEVFKKDGGTEVDGQGDVIMAL